MSENTPYYVAAAGIAAAVAAVVIIKSKALCPYIPQLPGCGTDDGGNGGGGDCYPSCEPPEQCLYGECVDTSEPEDECLIDTDCVVGVERCDSGQCVPLNAPIQGVPEIRTFGVGPVEPTVGPLTWTFPTCHLSTVTGNITIVDPHPGHWAPHAKPYVKFYALRAGQPILLGRLGPFEPGVKAFSFAPGLSGISGMQVIISNWWIGVAIGTWWWEKRLRLTAAVGEMRGWR